MLRVVSSAIRVGVGRITAPKVTNIINTAACKSNSLVNPICIRALSFNTLRFPDFGNGDVCKNRTLLSAPLSHSILPVSPNPTTISNRQLTKFSLRKGKRKSVGAVTDRFYRLRWGIWIRTKCGRHNHLWRKSLARKRRLYRHVFCNGKQSTLLDTMVTKFWKRPKFYVDDIYEPYHTRENFYYSRKKPLP